MTIDTDKAPRIAFTVNSRRVEHYSDVIKYIVNDAVSKARAEGLNPTKEEIAFFEKEVVRYAVIRHDLETAMKLKLKKRELL